jgi:cation:H+ antiporter
MGALIYGSDFIVKESEKIALHFDISPFIIGATLVAVGTSLPEMAVSISASFKGNGDIAVANVVGSTIFNIGLVLGSVFLIAKKITPDRDIFAKDSSWSLFPIFLFILMGFDGSIDRFDGILFVLMMIAYVLFLIQSNQVEQINQEIQKEKFNWFKSLTLLLIGFVLTISGADFAVDSASSIAKSFGVSEWIIGIFLVAFGTSLPELVVSIQAALKNNADMAIGAIIGSNVANFTMVLGVSSVINPLHVNFHLSFFDILTALIISVMLVFITANKLYNKSAGIVLLSVVALVIRHSFYG